jgi:hypothetical protein
MTGIVRVGQVGNLRRIGNPPEDVSEHCKADCQSAAGYQPALQAIFAGTRHSGPPARIRGDSGTRYEYR